MFNLNFLLDILLRSVSTFQAGASFSSETLNPGEAVTELENNKMGEQDPLVLSYSHLKDFSREKEALHTLKKIASLVKPIMRARGWVVSELAEFFPPQANLLGTSTFRHDTYTVEADYVDARFEREQGPKDPPSAAIPW